MAYPRPRFTASVAIGLSLFPSHSSEDISWGSTESPFSELFALFEASFGQQQIYRRTVGDKATGGITSLQCGIAAEHAQMYSEASACLIAKRMALEGSFSSAKNVDLTRK